MATESTRSSHDAPRSTHANAAPISNMNLRRIVPNLVEWSAKTTGQLTTGCRGAWIGPADVDGVSKRVPWLVPDTKNTGLLPVIGHGERRIGGSV